MKRTLAYGYGLVCYGAFLAVFLYTIGFVANVFVPKSIDSGTPGSTGQALLVNTLLLALFAVQHSGMARRAFKRWWTSLVAEAIERSTYVLASSLTLAVVFWQWRPMPTVLWSVEPAWIEALVWIAYGTGWLLVVVSAQLINSGHLFGLQQVRQHARGESPSSPEFQTPALYQYVRHPLMMGFLIAFWITPHMTVGHLVFALGVTAYVLGALQLEERDLIRQFGERYRRYRARVPMLLPRPGRTLPALDEPGESLHRD